ncbi:MAG: hypothetical protein SFW62_09295 [Alphaproteobacteria bacterium]|nr:hypothetical protein [Alphaproteobacteria bacterium]
MAADFIFFDIVAMDGFGAHIQAAPVAVPVKRGFVYKKIGAGVVWIGPPDGASIDGWYVAATPKSVEKDFRRAARKNTITILSKSPADLLRRHYPKRMISRYLESSAKWRAETSLVPK